MSNEDKVRIIKSGNCIANLALTMFWNAVPSSNGSQKRNRGPYGPMKFCKDSSSQVQQQ